MEYEKCLIVGGGAMAVDHHVPRLKKYLDCSELMIFEINENRRVQLKKRFGHDKHVTVIDALPGHRQFDLIVIATPPKFHLRYFEDLSDVTDSFLIEKPVAMNAAEAQEVESISKNLNKTVFVNLIRRTLKSYSLISEIISSGRFGSLLDVSVFEGSVFNWKAVSAGSFSRALNGGGVLMDTGPHTVDLMYQVFDDLILSNSIMDGQSPAIEANCQLNLLGNGEVPIQISLSRNRNFSNTALFKFEHAELEVGVLGETVEVREHSGWSYQMMANGIEKNPTWPSLVDQFYSEYLVGGDNTGVGPAESLKIAQIIDAAYTQSEFREAAF